MSAVTAERLESLCEVCEAYVEDHPAHENDVDIAKCMREYQALLAASQWIDVRERLPEEGESVLVSYDYHGKKYIEKTCVHRGEFLFPSNAHVAEGWRPLPAAYTGGGK